ncbi:MBL fold metallo-hydrolase [Anaerobacillus sp. MEB173]|uniref:MBL fold metallo-hydrolase n=1 Tax=Anaerobacillus sp. MEB173 TaxID=3383345 RepID=UPI003F8F61CB
MDQHQMSYGSDYKFIPAISIANGSGVEVLPDLYSYTVQIVNIVFVGEQKGKGYVLIDAGMPGSADEIISVAEERFGKDNRPKAIILTHGHFDHVGAILELVEYWNIPVYAHELEIPFLTGKKSYPDPDPTVEGGMIAKVSSLFPNESINLGEHVKPLPTDGSIPHIHEFQWLHTPGHTPGHISIYREKDRSLIAGDAFVAVRQDSLYSVLTQKSEISGPPRYFTPDWESAWQSVNTLAELDPAIAITGHGLALTGEQLSKGLKNLANEFDQIAIPDYGKAVKRYKH